MNDIDHERVANLLHIAEACTGHSGKLSNLQSWAIGELMKINAEIKAEAVEDKKATEARLAAESQQKSTGLPAEPGGEKESEDDNEVDLQFGAPRSVPATELGGSTTTQVDRRV